MKFRQVLAVGLTAAAVWASALAPGAVAEVSDQPLPTSIASLGDSITRGFNACGFYKDCTSRSWSTGDDGRVDSHRLRLRQLGVVLTGQFNFARTGARAEMLPDQARRAVAAGAQYVTIEIGANDACRQTEGDMTSPDDYRRHIEDALAILAEATPPPRVFVASIPDLYRLWAVGHGAWYMRKAWDKLDICQSMLAHPDSTAPDDVHRRARVRTRTILYNDILAEACMNYGALCKFDDKAVFETMFTRGQISKWDCFHPNEAGQELLADVTWAHGLFRPLAFPAG